MPNWCDNVVTFKHDDPKQIAKVVRAYNAGELMEKFFPCPKELRDTTSGFFGAGTPEQAALERQEQSNKTVFGYASWYDWCCNEWGTKWDVGRDQKYGDKVKIKRGATEVTLTFNSAWSPPTAFYEKMCDQLGFEIDAKYCETGVGFIGRWINGVDEPYDLSECPAMSRGGIAWLEKNVPHDLLDTFGLLEGALEQASLEAAEETDE